MVQKWMFQSDFTILPIVHLCIQNGNPIHYFYQIVMDHSIHESNNQFVLVCCDFHIL